VDNNQFGVNRITGGDESIFIEGRYPETWGSVPSWEEADLSRGSKAIF
jgi:hypothetical protein